MNSVSDGKKKPETIRIFYVTCMHGCMQRDVACALNACLDDLKIKVK